MGDWVGSGRTVEGVCVGRSADRAPSSADGHEHRIATDRNRIRAKPAGGRGNARASSPDALAAIAARESAAADQHIKDLALVIDGTPEVYPLAGDPNNHLVQV